MDVAAEGMSLAGAMLDFVLTVGVWGCVAYTLGSAIGAAWRWRERRRQPPTIDFDREIPPPPLRPRW